MRITRTLTALVAATALLLAGCASGGDTEGGGGGGDGASSSSAPTQLTIVQEAAPVSFDPAEAYGWQPPAYQPVYDSLIRRLPDGSYVPMLATSWEYSDDYKTLSLELRDDVTFIDGEKFDAEAAKANIEHYRDAEGTTGAADLALISDVEVTGEYSIDIHLSDVQPMLVEFLSFAAGFQASPKALGTEGIKTDPVGSGPYLFDADASTIGEDYYFEKNPDYWDPELQKFDRINIKVMGDQTARVNALISGQVDVASVDLKSMGQVERAGMTPVLQDGPTWGIHLSDREGRLSPVLTDVRVRQGLNHAFDRDAIAKAIFDDRATGTSQAFNPNSGGFVAELDDAYPYDPEKGRELIKAAGQEGATVGVTIMSYTDPALKAVIVDSFAAVGLTAQLNELAASDVWAVAGPDQPAVFWGVGSGGVLNWNQLYSIILPGAPMNVFSLEDPTVDELYAEMLANLDDDDKVNAASQEMNRYLTEQAWWVPLYRSPIPLFVNGDKVTAEPQVGQNMPSIYNYSPVG